MMKADELRAVLAVVSEAAEGLRRAGVVKVEVEGVRVELGVGWVPEVETPWGGGAEDDGEEAEETEQRKAAKRAAEELANLHTT